MLLLAWTVLGCNTQVEPAAPLTPAASRTVSDAVASPDRPDCALLKPCADVELDPALCIDEVELFDVETFDGEVVAISVDEDAATRLRLRPARYYGLFPDPAGGCELVTVGFDVDEAGDAI